MQIDTQAFFRNDFQSIALKICGVTHSEDAERLVERGVAALGVNFWPHSKRYVAPQLAAPWLQDCNQQIGRIGVFVNAKLDDVRSIFDRGLIDFAQLHGDEAPEYIDQLVAFKIPCIKAFGVSSVDDFSIISGYRSLSAVLLDTHAPGAYGGTGITFDWDLAKQWLTRHPALPLILAGGVQPQNLASACDIRPAMIDVASGAESSPGIKDFQKIDRMIQILKDFSNRSASNS